MRCILAAFYLTLLIASPIAALGQSGLEKKLVADPLLLSNGRTLFLYRQGPQLVAERWDWSSGNGARQVTTIASGNRNLESLNYAITVSSSGVWVANDSTVWLLLPNGKFLLSDLPKLPAERCESIQRGVRPLAVALNDGSLLLWRVLLSPTPPPA